MRGPDWGDPGDGGTFAKRPTVARIAANVPTWPGFGAQPGDARTFPDPETARSDVRTFGGSAPVPATVPRFRRATKRPTVALVRPNVPPSPGWARRENIVHRSHVFARSPERRTVARAGGGADPRAHVFERAPAASSDGRTFGQSAPARAALRRLRLLTKRGSVARFLAARPNVLPRPGWAPRGPREHVPTHPGGPVRRRPVRGVGPHPGHGPTMPYFCQTSHRRTDAPKRATAAHVGAGRATTARSGVPCMRGSTARRSGSPSLPGPRCDEPLFGRNVAPSLSRAQTCHRGPYGGREGHDGTLRRVLSTRSDGRPFEESAPVRGTDTFRRSEPR